MKRLVYIICLILAVSSICAQQHYEKLKQDMQDNVTIHESSAITSLLNEKVSGTTGETKQITGYRVQIYSSNSQQTAKAEALRLEKRVLEENMEVEVHVLYTPPFWKVRLGDFRTKAEADLMKAEVIRRMPELQGDTYVVRDQITVKK
ncbi:MAG: SPOR domain-containing protein [Bacteroidales bacterium]|nr:SPOR domain-containing protein [Candidatus Colicola faecequi]